MKQFIEWIIDNYFRKQRVWSIHYNHMQKECNKLDHSLSLSLPVRVGHDRDQTKVYHVLETTLSDT